MTQTVTHDAVAAFARALTAEEKAPDTVRKYASDVTRFAAWLGPRPLDKPAVLAYKAALAETCAPATVNAALASLNRFFAHIDRPELKTRSLKIQRSVFSSPEKELTKAEYERLLRAARQLGNERLYLLLQTVCSTGIRVSELRFITVEAAHTGTARIVCKGKRRPVFLPRPLCKLLRSYAKDRRIKSGPVFITRNGNPLDRSNIWSDMKKLCSAANVPESKVFPHNLRHLFARTYYSLQKDIVRLADILGHSSVNTTRIYTLESGEVHRRQIQKLGLVLCQAP